MNIIRCICNIMEGFVMYLSFLAIAKYVFFEKDLEGAKKKYFQYFTVISIVASAILLSEYLDIVVVGLVVVWTLLDFKRHKWSSVIEVIPIVGIVNGLLVPIIVMPEAILSISDTVWTLVKIGIYSVALICLGLIIRHNGLMLTEQNEVESEDAEHGKMHLQTRLHECNRGIVFREEPYSRNLNRGEKTLLYGIGFFELIFSNLMARANFNLNSSEEMLAALAFIVFLLGISTFIMTVIVILVIMVGNKRSFYYDKISDMQFNTIVMMADIVENRDKDTGGHIQRTAKYVEIIANQMKKSGAYKDVMTKQFINDIQVAAPLHDVGKIHVSDLILNKPGRLTDEEFEIMKTHAEEGRKLLTHARQHLGDFSYLDIAIDMAGYHHEWWDGSAKGYPEHRKGEEIPLCARIMAVADVFDALTARRCYKDPMPVDKAIAIIKEESGTHFDPVVVEAFLRAIEQIQDALTCFEEVM